MASSVRRRQLGPFAVRSTEILIAEGGEEHHTLRRSVGPLPALWALPSSRLRSHRLASAGSFLGSSVRPTPGRVRNLRAVS